MSSEEILKSETAEFTYPSRYGEQTVTVTHQEILHTHNGKHIGITYPTLNDWYGNCDGCGKERDLIPEEIHYTVYDDGDVPVEQIRDGKWCDTCLTKLQDQSEE